MTKEEYERLLKSDYWKGYSYSLIKERDYTCADCGRRFPNERHKLQVHHLHYRDANPWSYEPNELVVLCQECHALRHGKWSTSYSETSPSGNFSTYNDTSSVDLNSKSVGAPPFNPLYGNNTSNSTSESHYDKSAKSSGWSQSHYEKGTNGNSYLTKWWFYIIPLLSLGFIIYIAVNIISSHISFNEHYNRIKSEIEAEASRMDEDFQSNEIEEMSSYNDYSFDEKEEPADNEDVTGEMTEGNVISHEGPNANKEKPVSQHPSATPIKQVANEQEKVNTTPTQVQSKPQKEDRELTTLELMERRSHERAVEDAKREGVSTSGSTLDIMERISHKHAVEDAKREGVSTEGSTLDIMERISHKHAVDDAKREGVSTSGSTLDIMERISHKHAVEDAKREGVSTEGTTLDIMERISRKHLLESGY